MATATPTRRPSGRKTPPPLTKRAASGARPAHATAGRGAQWPTPAGIPAESHGRGARWASPAGDLAKLAAAAGCSRAGSALGFPGRARGAAFLPSAPAAGAGPRGLLRTDARAAAFPEPPRRDRCRAERGTPASAVPGTADTHCDWTAETPVRAAPRTAALPRTVRRRGRVLCVRRTGRPWVRSAPHVDKARMLQMNAGFVGNPQRRRINYRCWN